MNTRHHHRLFQGCGRALSSRLDRQIYRHVTTSTTYIESTPVKTRDRPRDYFSARIQAESTPLDFKSYSYEEVPSVSCGQWCAPVSYYRGGTSRALIFYHTALPFPRTGIVGSKAWELEKQKLWADVFRKCIGSPDSNGRQLDGMGGAVSSLSKVLVVKATPLPKYGAKVLLSKSETDPVYLEAFYSRSFLRAAMEETPEAVQATPEHYEPSFQRHYDIDFIEWFRKFSPAHRNTVFSLDSFKWIQWFQTFLDKRARDLIDDAYGGTMGKVAQKAAGQERLGIKPSGKGVLAKLSGEELIRDILKSEDSVDVEYTFASIGIRNGVVDFSANCGNMSSAVGPYAIDRLVKEGLVDYKRIVARANASITTYAMNQPMQSPERMLKVRIRNTNTGKILTSTFRVLVEWHEGREQEVPLETATHGDFEIDGVEGKGAKIELAYEKPGGSKTGKLLPTGNVLDTFNGIKTTCIDCGNPSVFVAASNLSVPGSGTLLPDDLESHPELMTQLEDIRCQAAIAMGLATSIEKVPESIPKIAIVSKPTTHVLTNGKEIVKKDVDLVARAISVGQWHRAVPVTVAMSLAAAAGLKGTVVEGVLGKTRKDKVDGEVMIGHPSGKILVGAKFDAEGEVESVEVFRTARRIMDGIVYWR